MTPQQQIEELKSHIEEQIEELKSQIKPKPIKINLKHNHSGGEYVRIKHSNLLINLEAGTAKITPGTVNGWIKIVVNGTIYYIPTYTSKTT